jgi:hypothetical protein
MSFLFEIVFELIGELLFGLVGEVLSELGFHGTAEKISVRGKGSRWLIGLAYFVFGGAVGWLSLFIFPPFLLPETWMVIAYLIISSLAAGIMLSLVSWLINRGIRPVKPFELDKFLFGVVFALAYATSRVLFR